ncbi:MAG: glycoside hydrolase family 127 protein [Clostridiales bacterium]|nr:glycoside hydrolase family 127 protein [Clostridiales bacterium]
MGKWRFYTSKELKPAGWLRDQLTIQANGLSGHLHEVWPDVRDSAWIGGDRDAWERVPYWLDGFIPLAYLLDDEAMKATAKRYVDAILAGQQEDGWICPCKKEERPKYDTWAVQLISKALTVYWQCSGDERAIAAARRVMKNYFDLLSGGEVKLFCWGEHRWFEAFICLNELWRLKPELWIKELAKLLAAQGTDYEKMSPLWKRPLNKWTYDTHIVNLAMMLKEEAVTCELLDLPYTDRAGRLYGILKEYNGTPVELFTGDECLSGLSPIQGTELCAVVEQMYSLELLYAYTGDKKWAERLETVAFNALPATLSDDMWTHQYDQMSNQIACIRFPGKPIFRTNGPESHLFGLEPGYGCCTSNFSQGWPKFALSAFMHSESAVLSAVPVPSVLTTKDFTLRLDSEYPFKNTLKYTVDAEKPFRLEVRVPSFAENLKVNGAAHKTCDLCFDIPAGSGQVIEISFESSPRFIDRPNGLRSVKCGSLLFSLPIPFIQKKLEYVRDGVERKYPYCDWELIPAGKWNYAFCGEPGKPEERAVNKTPFSSAWPPVTLDIPMRPIKWDYEDGYDTVCAKLPGTEPAGEAETKTLYPYGCAKLRMTEMPLINSK